MPTASRYRWVVLAVGALAQGVNAASFLGLPAITPQLRAHFGLDLAQVGLLVGAVNLGNVLALVAWGLLADRYGERLVMAAGLFGTAGCLVLAGAVDSPLAAGLALLASGVFGASTNAASGRAVMTWFASGQRGLAMGVRQTATPLGAALAAVLLPAVAAWWQAPAAFLALAALNLLVGVAVAVWVREPPGLDRVVVPVRGGLGLLRDPRMLRLSLVSGLLVVPQFVGAAMLVELLHRYGLALGAAGGLLAVAQVLGGAGRLANGVWSDRVGSRLGPLRTVSLGVFGLYALAALLDPLHGVLPVWLPVMVLLPAVALAISWNGLAITAAGELAPPGRTGVAMAVQNTANYVSASLTPALAGWTASGVGWPAALGLAAAGGLLAWVLLRGLR
ncbi:MFS family permease [Crossiella equi]|uniref:MFS family permease n=1 Tax=Crossiella equi TaxID=130796 RepID=A0ABS5AHJ8_9PSEU|nr:MFS transporter [Crossiella equi]MBP2475842.1 MFS family permease [Crossiella equi]